MDKSYFETLARYNRWANIKLYNAVEVLPKEEFEKDRQAYFESIQGTLNHILFGDWAWTLRLKGESSAHLEMGKIYHPDFHSLKEARIQTDDGLLAVIEAMSEDQLERELTYRNVKGDEFSVPRR